MMLVDTALADVLSTQLEIEKAPELLPDRTLEGASIVPVFAVIVRLPPRTNPPTIQFPPVAKVIATEEVVAVVLWVLFWPTDPTPEYS